MTVTLCEACAHGKHVDHDFSATAEPCNCMSCSNFDSL